MKSLSLLMAILAMTLIALPGQAQQAQTPVISGPPDVLVIVYQQPGGADQVDITYAHTVPRAQAVQDTQALTQATGWPISPRSIKDAAAPMEGRFGPMTSIVFQVPGVVQDSAHTFPVETFARAFHTYKRLNVVFFTGAQFQFQGSRAYADNDIKMALSQSGTTYTYQIAITNPNFGRLPPAASPANAQGSAGHRSPWRVLLAILGLASLIGLAVYFLTARLNPPPGPKAKLDNTDTEAETRLEAGTRG